jgi:hypothetical protein
VTARLDTDVDGTPDDIQIMIQRLLSGHVQLLKNVVIGTADKNAAFLHSHVLCQLEIVFRSSYPACHLRVFITPLLAFVYRFLVSVAVKEELTLADDALGASEPMQHIKQLHDLFSGVWRP